MDWRVEYGFGEEGLRMNGGSPPGTRDRSAPRRGTGRGGGRSRRVQETTPLELLRRAQIPPNTTLVPPNNICDFRNMMQPGTMPFAPAIMSGLGWQQLVLHVAPHGPPSVQLQVQLSAMGHPSLQHQDPSRGFPSTSDSNVLDNNS